MIDSDKSGEISVGEWETAIDGAFSAIDYSGDGKVNWCEVGDAFSKFKEDQASEGSQSCGDGIAMKDLKGAFTMIDTDADGILTWDEVKQTVGALAEEHGAEMDDGDFDTLKLAYNKIAEIDGVKGVSSDDWSDAIDAMWPILDVD